MKDYYSILGVPRNVSNILIKKQFRKLAALYHPDNIKLTTPLNYETESSANMNKFIELNEAYNVLISPEKRLSYDKSLREKESLLDKGKKISPYRTRIRDGADVSIDMDFSTEEIHSASPIIYKNTIVERFIKCPSCDGAGKEKGTLIIVCTYCNGTGLIKNKENSFSETCQHCNGYGDIILYKCKKCNGNGRIKNIEETNLEFNKSNLINGNKIKFSSKGDEGAFGGGNGDLIVSVNIDADVLNKINNSDKGFFLKRLFLKK
jgi:molecular chaperone DnaJ